MLLSCSASSQLGEPCTLIALTADGGRRYLTDAELAGDKKDFISFGSLDCEDLICVRTSGGHGYCSKGCEVDTGCPAPMVCRALLPNDKFCVRQTTF